MRTEPFETKELNQELRRRILDLAGVTEKKDAGATLLKFAD